MGHWAWGMGHGAWGKLSVLPSATQDSGLRTQHSPTLPLSHSPTQDSALKTRLPLYQRGSLSFLGPTQL
ncbi:hypothetical protein [Microcoleus sp. FACHB-68]|uniref:hypothetical protein n=1 Tax=Microcoleus sp. FACHB-68 TaxID=2692826 RepID=UPI0016865E3D|nr:hypothetical protein [Microcoleus sp. FACHB-68]MBD1936439.1 hypothetical protein [Microcoleus sp. FACHB-68]